MGYVDHAWRHRPKALGGTDPIEFGEGCPVWQAPDYDTDYWNDPSAGEPFRVATWCEKLYVRGMLQDVNSGAQSFVGTVPAGMEPAEQVYWPVYVENQSMAYNGGFAEGYVLIDPSGDINCYYPTFPLRTFFSSVLVASATTITATTHLINHPPATRVYEPMSLAVMLETASSSGSVVLDFYLPNFFVGPSDLFLTTITIASGQTVGTMYYGGFTNHGTSSPGASGGRDAIKVVVSSAGTGAKGLTVNTELGINFPYSDA